MAITSYAELKSEINKYILDDVTDIAATAIRAVEDVINREIRHRKMEKTATATLASGEQYLEMPNDFLEVRSITVQSNPLSVLGLVSEAELNEQFADGSSGIPTKYALTADYIKIGPRANADYTVQLVYYAEIDHLSDGNTSNWLLAKHPDIYLYGSLLQASPAVRDEKMLATAANFFERGLDGLRNEAERTKWASGPVSVKFDFEVI